MVSKKLWSLLLLIQVVWAREWLFVRYDTTLRGDSGLTE
jgi:hypothetical protein